MGREGGERGAEEDGEGRGMMKAEGYGCIPYPTRHTQPSPFPFPFPHHSSLIPDTPPAPPCHLSSHHHTRSTKIELGSLVLAPLFLSSRFLLLFFLHTVP